VCARGGGSKHQLITPPSQQQRPVLSDGEQTSDGTKGCPNVSQRLELQWPVWGYAGSRVSTVQRNIAGRCVRAARRQQARMLNHWPTANYTIALLHVGTVALRHFQ
jgi:hypothetical protein